MSSGDAWLAGLLEDRFPFEHLRAFLALIDELPSLSDKGEVNPAQRPKPRKKMGPRTYRTRKDPFENGWPKINVPQLHAELFDSLKPGGTLGLIDHYADAGSPRETGGTLHRIDPGIVIPELEQAGFVLEAKSDMLRNIEDDHSLGVFDPSVRGKTDRFVLRFKKPE